MIWVVCGVIVMSLIYPFHMAVSYFHSKYWFVRGHTNQEKYHHYQRSFIAIAQFVLMVGIAMFVWGVCDMTIKDSMLKTRQIDGQTPVFSHSQPMGP